MQTSFRVLTFNIHKGLGASGLTSQLAELRLVLRETNTDMVFLQEVMGESKNDAHRRAGVSGDQLEYLADSVWPHYAYGQNSVHGNGHHGNAILSKFPILSWENLDISTNNFEHRGLLHASVGLPEWPRPIELICLHLNLLGGGRSRQIKDLVVRVQKHIHPGSPLMIAGDFNDWRGMVSEILKKELGVHEASLSHHGQHRRTFPAWLPILPLDRIYFRGLNLLEVDTLDHQSSRRISDHQAILAEFSFQT